MRPETGRAGRVGRGGIPGAACGESVSDGEHLTGGTTDLLAHAGVALPVDGAEECGRVDPAQGPVARVGRARLSRIGRAVENPGRAAQINSGI
ncbi:hypothetical protein [Streptomyces sp. NPDC007905]|uniref:hypothetical protein n=1 Tax=Streptomyces sp. NPDC007905 TaxID=3364788 RepID=UPI0036E77186